jgi:Aminoglycoside-2''-adenylyltransferase
MMAARSLPRVDMERAERQLGLISDAVATAADVGVQVWLRGGWAMDFFLGEVTRDHVDIDWFAWAADATVLQAGLLRRGYRLVGGAPVEQQLDVAQDGQELSFAWLARDQAGQVVVAGGPWAGKPYPAGMLEGAPGRICQLCSPVISPAAQIEIKLMMPVWVPGRPRRAKDAQDVARLRAASRSGGAGSA